MTVITVIAIVGIALFLAASLIWLAKNIEDPVKQAGKRGEEVASDIIKEVLHDDEILLTNIPVSFESNRTELDNVIISSRGVFIIEVKNYVGHLEGEEDDFEWKKYKTTSKGDIYVKKVKNPIHQVKRQIYILGNALRKAGFDVWVEGYVILLYNNSPVASEMVLESKKDIDRALHHRNKSYLSEDDIKRICSFL